ncbi:MAG TPA: hypothetical protein VHO02_09480 [Fibrobacteria bacterium]|nr:hypothetical protein [Fibrobacteria bacterium]
MNDLHTDPSIDCPPGASPDAIPAVAKDTTPRGRHDPILDPHRHGKDVDEPGVPGPAPRDNDDGGSKDARDQGNNGNPAQSSGRVSMAEQNAAPEEPGEPMP